VNDDDGEYVSRMKNIINLIIRLLCQETAAIAGD